MRERFLPLFQESRDSDTVKRINIREEALAEGMEKGLETAAKKALAEGATFDFIQKITGLDMETIKRLASNAGK